MPHVSLNSSGETNCHSIFTPPLTKEEGCVLCLRSLWMFGASTTFLRIMFYLKRTEPFLRVVSFIFKWNFSNIIGFLGCLSTSQLHFKEHIFLFNISSFTHSAKLSINACKQFFSHLRRNCSYLLTSQVAVSFIWTVNRYLKLQM